MTKESDMLRLLHMVVLASMVSSTFGASPRWGLLATDGLDGSPVKAVYLHPGSLRDGRHGYYAGLIPAKNTQLYTLTPVTKPADPAAPLGTPILGWSQSSTYRATIVDLARRTGANVLYLPTWGVRTTVHGGKGSDRWAPWAPMQSSATAADELFDAVASFNTTTSTTFAVIPAIECSPGTATTKAYHFAADFPTSLDETGTAPRLRRLLRDLIHHYLVVDGGTRRRLWARMYGGDDVPRYAVYLRQVASRSLRLHDDEIFARAFDLLAKQVALDTGVNVGFIVELLPLRRRDGGHHDTFVASAATIPALLRTSSILAVQGFLSETYVPTDQVPALNAMASRDRDERLAVTKQSYLRTWSAGGLPCILDVTPGRDARLKLPGSLRYGYDDYWLNWQSELKTATLAGIALTGFNDFTEGMATVPAKGDILGPAQIRTDLAQRWATELLTPNPRDARQVHFVSNQASVTVTGPICRTWLDTGGSRPDGALGEPLPTEQDTGVAGARVRHFVNGFVYLLSSGMAYEVHGPIWRAYVANGRETGALGLPASNEHAWFDGTQNVRRSLFRNGFITWTAGGGAVVHLGR